MEVLGDVLPILIYLLLAILLVICIIVGIKLINNMVKLEKMIDSIQQKVDSLKGVFDTIDFVTNKVNKLGDTIFDFVSNGIKKIFKNKEKEIDK
ncbi:MAG: hypothetical protein RR228_00445 [Bacilli bacterium]